MVLWDKQTADEGKECQNNPHRRQPIITTRQGAGFSFSFACMDAAMGHSSSEVTELAALVIRERCGLPLDEDRDYNGKSCRQGVGGSPVEDKFRLGTHWKLWLSWQTQALRNCSVGVAALVGLPATFETPDPSTPFLQVVVWRLSPSFWSL